MYRINKKYIFLDDLLESMRLYGYITSYSIDNESGILSYNIKNRHFETDICAHTWHEVGDELPRIKIRRIVRANSRGEIFFTLRLLERVANNHDQELGGFIEREENLSQNYSCFVYGNARVYGNAIVFDNARVSEDAEVFDNARVSGNTKVYGNARVYGNAIVFGTAEVYNNAKVFGDAKVYNNAKVFGDAKVYNNAKVYGNAEVHGRAQIFDDAILRDNVRVYDNAKIYGRMDIYGNRDIFETIRNEIFKESDTLLFSNEILNKQSSHDILSLVTIPQLIREYSKTGNYDYVIPEKYEVNDRYNTHVIRAMPPKYHYNAEGIAVYNDTISIEIPWQLSIELLPSRTKSEQYKAKYKILSNIFGSNRRGEPAEQKLARCFEKANKNLNEYNSVCKLIFNNKDYGKYDILDEFTMFFKVFNEKLKLNKAKWEENQELFFNDFIEEYIKTSKLKYKNQKDELFRDLRENYFNLEFINLFNEFSKIIEENKGHLKGQNAIEIDSRLPIGKNVRIFAPNGAVITRATFREREDIDGEYQIIRKMNIAPVKSTKNIIAYNHRSKNIFQINPGEDRALEEVARYAKNNNDTFKRTLDDIKNRRQAEKISDLIPQIKDTRTWRGCMDGNGRREQRGRQ